MKKLFLSITLLAGLSAGAQAQGTRIGFKAGASLTNFTGDVSEANYKFGAHAGILFNLGVSQAFSVQPEILYSMKGAKAEGSIYGSTIKYKETLHYIDVPILAKYNTGGLFFEAGPQLGFLVHANASQETSGYGSSSTDITSRYQTVDFGYALGLGYQTDGPLLVGLRYNGGIANIVKNSGSFSQRNGGFQLYVGYLLHGK